MSQEHLSWLKDHFREIHKTPILEDFLGLEVVELSEGKSVLCTKIIDKHCNFYGTVHGGTLASIADTVMGCACTTLEKRIVAIDMNISYIRNVPAGSTLTAVGEVIHNGKTIMRAVCKIFNEDKLLVRAQASYFVTGRFCKEDYPQSQ